MEIYLFEVMQRKLHFLDVTATAFYDEFTGMNNLMLS